MTYSVKKRNWRLHPVRYTKERLAFSLYNVVAEAMTKKASQEGKKYGAALTEIAFTDLVRH